MTVIQKPASLATDVVDIENVETILRGAVELNTRARMGQQMQIYRGFADAVLLLNADLRKIVSRQVGMHFVSPKEQEALAEVERIRQEKRARQELLLGLKSILPAIEKFSATLDAGLKAKDASESQYPEQATTGGKPKAVPAGRAANARD